MQNRDSLRNLISKNLHESIFTKPNAESLLQFALRLEDLGRQNNDNGILLAYHAHLWGCLLPLAFFGNENQKTKYLSKLCSGELIGAGAVTEKESGSDFFSMNSNVSNNGRLDGAKAFITNAPIADVFVTYAKRNDGSIDCFILDRKTPGLSCGAALEKSGLHSAMMGEVAFISCPLKEENRVGQPSAGYSIFTQSMIWERSFILAHSIGAMERIYSQTMNHARRKKSGERKLFDLENIQERFGEMALQIELTRLSTEQAVRALGETNLSLNAACIAKLQASEAYVSVCRTAMEILGGQGYLVSTGIEQELRDALAGTIYSGASSIMRKIIAGTAIYGAT